MAVVFLAVHLCTARIHMLNYGRATKTVGFIASLLALADMDHHHVRRAAFGLFAFENKGKRRLACVRVWVAESKSLVGQSASWYDLQRSLASRFLCRTQKRQRKREFRMRKPNT